MARLMPSSSLLALACLALALSHAHALYSAGSKVIQLGEKDFKQVTKGDELWLVEFYAPYASPTLPHAPAAAACVCMCVCRWCGHCKNLAPEWEKAASALSGVVKVAAVGV